MPPKTESMMIESHLMRTAIALLFFLCVNYVQGSDDQYQHIQTLVYQAQMGTINEKIKAINNLVYAAIDPQRQALVLKSGALPVFVNLLQSGTFETKLSACQGIGALTSEESIRQTIGQSRAIENLHALLSDERIELKVASLQVLGNLMQDQGTQKRLLDINGAGALTVALMSNNDQMRRVAAGTIGNIGMYPENIPSLQESGAISLLVDLLRSGSKDDADPLTVEVTVGALRNLAQVDPPLQAMLGVGALSVLEALLDDYRSTDATKELATEIIDFLLDYQQHHPVDERDEIDIFDEL